MKKLLLGAVIFFIFGAAVVMHGGSLYIFAENYEPEISASSAIVIDAVSGRVLWKKNSHAKQFPASTTKIMTALLAIESGHGMKEMVEISENAAKTEGSSIYCEAGELISFQDLLYALMLRSGNDAGVALAEHIAVSAENFAKLMNQKAEQLGAKDTHFVTVNGLHDDNHYTTAYDMALISREAMKNDVFRKIAATRVWNASREVDKFNYFTNKNKVLYQYDGGNGIKIGYTTTAGRCLVASSEREGMELICVVFNAPDWFNDSYRLMDYIYDNYDAKVVIKAQEPIAAVNVRSGEKGQTWLIADHDIVLPQRPDENPEISFKVEAVSSVNAPVSRWDEAGRLRIFYNDEEVGNEKLFFREDIDRANKDLLNFYHKIKS